MKKMPMPFKKADKKEKDMKMEEKKPGKKK